MDLKIGINFSWNASCVRRQINSFFFSSSLKRNGKSGYLDELIQDRRNDLEYVCNFFDIFVLGRFVSLEIITD